MQTAAAGVDPQRCLGQGYGVLDGGRLMGGVYDPKVTWIQPPVSESLGEVEEFCLAYAAELHATGGLLAEWRPTIAEAARHIARHAHTTGPQGMALARDLARIAGTTVEIAQPLGDDRPPEASDQRDELDGASPPDTDAPPRLNPLPIPAGERAPGDLPWRAGAGGKRAAGGLPRA